MKKLHYTSREDAIGLLAEADVRGIPESDWETVLEEYDYYQFKQNSSESIIPSLIKSTLVSAPDVVSKALGGGADWIAPIDFNLVLERAKKAGRGEISPFNVLSLRDLSVGITNTAMDPMGIVSKVLNLTSDMIKKGGEAVIPPYWGRESAEGQSGPMWGEGAGRTWASLVGQNLPVLAVVKVSQALGGALGGPVAAHAAGFVSMMDFETANIEQQIEPLGLDEDLVEQVKAIYGPGSGAIEYLQQLLYLHRWGKPPITKAQYLAALPKSLIRRFLKGAAGNLFDALFEGSEEATQTLLANRLIDWAVDTQNERNRKKNLPDVDKELVNRVKEGYARAFGAGAIVSTVTGGAGRVKGGIQTEVELVRSKKIAERLSGDLETLKRAVDLGLPLESLPFVGEYRKKGMSTLPAGEAEVLEGAKAPLSDKEKKAILEQLPYVGETFEVEDKHGKKVEVHRPGLSELAKRWGVSLENENGVRKDQETLRHELMSMVGAVKEGPTLQQTPPHLKGQAKKRTRLGFRGKVYEKGQTLPDSYVDLVVPTISRPNPRDRARGRKVMELINGTLRLVKTPYGQWADSLFKAIKRGEPTEALIREGRKMGIPLETIRQFISTVNEKGVKLKIEGQDTELPAAERARRIDAMRWKALATLFGEKVADELIPLRTRVSRKTGEIEQVAAIKEPEILPGRTLEDVLTRDQYAAYTDLMEGFLREMVREVKGDDTLFETQTEVEDAYIVAPMTTPDGRVVDTTSVPDTPHISFLRSKMASLFFSMEALAHKYPHIPFIRLDRIFSHGHKLEMHLNILFKTLEKSIWRKLPRSLRTGEPAARIADYVAWRMTDGKQKGKMAKVLGVLNSNAGLLAYVKEKSTVKDSAEIERWAKYLETETRKLYNWFAKNGAVTPDKFRRDYVPVYYLYMNDPKRGDMSLEEWIYQKRKAKKVPDELAALQEDEIEDIIDIASSMKLIEGTGVAVPGRRVPTHEFARDVDQVWLQDVTQMTDIRDITEKYVRRAIRRMLYKRYIPGTAKIIQQVNNDLTGQDRERANQILSNYFSSILGVPDDTTRAMRQSRMFVDTNRKLINLSNKVLNWYNTDPLFSRLPRVELREEEAHGLSGQDVFDVSMTYLYATTLGIPFNFVSPIKNMLQSCHAIAAVGFPNWVRGMYALMYNEQVRKEIKQADLRPEFSLYEHESLGARGRWQAAGKVLLQFYRMSDLSNVYITAAAGIVSWDQLEKAMGADMKVTPDTVAAALFQGRRNLTPDPQEVMRHNIPSAFKPKKTISKSVALEIADMINRGEVQDAKEFYLQYLVNLTQWRYGAGGSPQYMSNSTLMRAIFMYTSWPVNYADFLTKVVRKDTRGLGMSMRYMQMWAMQTVLASIMTAGGIDAWKWIYLGPIPDELLPVGPLAVWAERILKILLGTARGAAGAISPFADDDEWKREFKGVKRQLDDLLDTRLIDPRPFEVIKKLKDSL